MPRRRKPKVGLGILALLAVAAAIIFGVPGIRHKITNEGHSLKAKVIPGYSPIAVARVTASGNGACLAPVLSSNETIYWYTRATQNGPQTLTITFPSGFSGTVSRVAFTPLVSATFPAAAGQASPYPQQVVVNPLPAGTSFPINLADPPKFQNFPASVEHPATLTLQLTQTDPGAATNTCAETGIVLYTKKG